MQTNQLTLRSSGGVELRLLFCLRCKRRKYCNILGRRKDPARLAPHGAEYVELNGFQLGIWWYFLREGIGGTLVRSVFL